MSLDSVELSHKQFEKVSRFVYRFSGINLKTGKEALVRARLMKRVRALRLENIDAYMKYLQSAEGARELGDMVDAMTTNKTGFFREAEHFNFMREKLLPEIKTSKMRFWTAACSSGEEPFSLAITLRESLSDIDSRDCLILATDISRRMLQKAWRAVYSQEAIRDLPAPIVRKYFHKITEGASPGFQVTDSIRGLVRFAWLNLMNPWPMSGPFNVIFCRNTMIYFDRGTQQKLITRFWDLLAPGGYLFVGHSEGLSGVSHKFSYVQPAIYKK
jgi:chemotaxis protein methyltransferase CheR